MQVCISNYIVTADIHSIKDLVKDKIRQKALN